MEKMMILGTGNAAVTKCYNTCFAIQNKNEYFLIDAGGGNGILTQLEKARIKVTDIHNIFISHEHTDHILGVVWMIRMVGTAMNKGEYEGNLNIYCHEELVNTIETISRLTVAKKFFRFVGERIILVPVRDKEVVSVMGYDVKFFDICSEKTKQYGFTMKLQNGKKFTFIGDEYYRDCEYEYALDSDWLLHEAFCLYGDRDIFKPYEKYHATVKDACENATKLNVKNLILYHTEDKNLEHRKELYTAEAREYYFGNVFVPDDLDVLEL